MMRWQYNIMKDSYLSTSNISNSKKLLNNGVCKYDNIPMVVVGFPKYQWLFKRTLKRKTIPKESETYSLWHQGPDQGSQSTPHLLRPGDRSQTAIKHDHQFLLLSQEPWCRPLHNLLSLCKSQNRNPPWIACKLRYKSVNNQRFPFKFVTFFGGIDSMYLWPFFHINGDHAGWITWLLQCIKSINIRWCCCTRLRS